MHRVFVYGTLKRGFPYHETGLKGQRFLGPARTREAFPLVVAGRWRTPVLVFEPGAGTRVLGEVYRVSARALAGLDELEGTGLPGGYARVRIAVEALAGGAAFEAWAYVKERAALDVVHLEYLEEYRLDPHYVPASRRR
jgi:gamma-glutamylaminecyclotransferase